MVSSETRRIGVLLSGLGLGGTERLVEEQVRVTRARGLPFDFVVFACSSRNDVLSKRLAPFGCPVVALSDTRRGVFDTLVSLRPALRRERIHLLHAHLPRAGVLARLTLGRESPWPHIYTEHNEQETYHPITRRLNALTLHWPDAVIAVSSPVHDGVLRASRSLRALGPTAGGRCRIILNGVDAPDIRSRARPRQETRRAWHVPNDAPVVGLVGHFRREKGHDTLLRAIAALNHPDLVVVFAGRDDGTERSVRELHQQLGLGDRVRFLGFQHDVASVLTALDILAMPSTREGLPVTLLEAMAIGVAVVATPAGGIPEVVVNETNGLLVPIGNPTALAAALQRILIDPSLGLRLGEAGRCTVDRGYSIDAMVDQYSAIYQQVLEGRRASRLETLPLHAL